MSKRVPEFLESCIEFMETEKFKTISENWNKYDKDKKENCLRSVSEKICSKLSLQHPDKMIFKHDDKKVGRHGWHRNIEGGEIGLRNITENDFLFNFAALCHELYHQDQQLGAPRSNIQQCLNYISNDIIANIENKASGTQDSLSSYEIGAHSINNTILEDKQTSFNNTFFCADIKYLKQVYYMNTNPDEFNGRFAFYQSDFPDYFKKVSKSWYIKTKKVCAYCDTEDADCSNIDFHDFVFKSKIENSDFSNNIFEDGIFINCIIENTNFSSNKFEDTPFVNSNFKNCNFSKSSFGIKNIIDKSSFINCDFTEVDLSKIDEIKGFSYFENCKISDTLENRAFISENQEHFKDIQWQEEVRESKSPKIKTIHEKSPKIISYS